YEDENRLWPPAGPHAPPHARNVRSTLVVLAALGLFHDLTLQPAGKVLGIAVDWHGLGVMDAGRVLGGEWWRTVTALTLHADGLHLLGNLALGGILFALLNAQLGVGLGMALALAAGALGNATNALARGPTHLSLGLSTAVFGALGALAVRAAWSTAWRDWRRWVLPLGAGAGLVAMVGVGDQETDYAAHLFGFGWGLVGGLLTRWPLDLRRPLGRAASLAVGLAAAARGVEAWAAALGRG
ncbi:MAG: rhomboid family intramembrane serine protease, partial [Deltaproteobacteria bacterium]|nr:rhomboid family intramembrane serine protease [Deltaproteobacteria bacterium]